MDNKIQYIILLYEKDSDGLFCSDFSNYAQEQYIRQQVASVKCTDYLEGDYEASLYSYNGL